MISGIINTELEPILRLEVPGPGPKSIDVEAIVDTGFTGHLTLTMSQITTLSLPCLRVDPGTLADGSIELFDVYGARVAWDGKFVPIEVQAADAQALLGMSLLLGYDVLLRVAVGGHVTIVETP